MITPRRRYEGITYHVYGGFGLHKVGSFSEATVKNSDPYDLAEDCAKRGSVDKGTAFIVRQEGKKFTILRTFYDGNRFD